MKTNICSQATIRTLFVSKVDFLFEFPVYFGVFVPTTFVYYTKKILKQTEWKKHNYLRRYTHFAVIELGSFIPSFWLNFAVLTDLKVIESDSRFQPNSVRL